MDNDIPSDIINEREVCLTSLNFPHPKCYIHTLYTKAVLQELCLSFDGITIIIAVVIMMLIVYFYSFLTCSNMLIDVSSCITKSHTSVFCLLFCISSLLAI